MTTHDQPTTWLLALLGLAVLVAPALAADLPEGRFQATPVLARTEGVVVRAEPGFIHRELGRLARGQKVLVDGRQGAWLHVRPSGWVLQEDVRGVDEPDAARSAEPRRVRVSREGARIRSAPTTEAALVRTAAQGEVLGVEGSEGGWWSLTGGGFLHQGLAEEVSAAPPDARRVPDEPSEVTSLERPARWSLLDLNGIVFEVSAIAARSPLIEQVRKEMRANGGLADDWTFLRLVIGAPQGVVRFEYSPDTNATVVVDDEGQKYGNVHARGPTERLPTSLRRYFEPHAVEPGEVFEALLMFRPTLDPARIRSVHLSIGGRPQELYRSP